MPNFWIEKTIVKERSDRQTGDYALGKALWSPQKGKSQSGERTKDVYKNMRLVKKDDIIIHLIDNKFFIGVSIAANEAINSIGIEGTEWEGPAYFIELKSYSQLNIPIDRNEILNASNRALLNQISKESEVFYNKDLNLRQGAYLTPCPKSLLNLLNSTYLKKTSKNLPHVSNSNLIQIHNQNKKLQFELNLLVKSLSKTNLSFDSKMIRRFCCALSTKPFVILTGLSGSGKTKLAQVFAKWICADESQYRLIPVGADWTNREPLVGYPNALEPGKYVLPETGALELILEAGKPGNQDKPYFLILDEMNLSHVERYFADFLSAMESGEDISLHSDTVDWQDEVPAKIKLPKNLFIVGTVNIDETTYMFSPKVLDRANVIEFRVTPGEMLAFLEAPKSIDLESISGLGADMAGSFVEMARDKDVEPTDADSLSGVLIGFFNELKKVGAEFGYRSASEIYRFVAIANKLDTEWAMDEILDCAIMQKLLPKVHGSRRKLEPVLKTLGKLCLADGKVIEDIFNRKEEVDFNDPQVSRFPISLEKIDRMYRGLLDNGFTSYAEA